MTEQQEGPAVVNPHVLAQNPTACEFCWRRKLKCSADMPDCSNCKKRGLTCNRDPSLRTSRPKRRRNDDEMEEWQDGRVRKPPPPRRRIVRQKSPTPPTPDSEEQPTTSITQPIQNVHVPTMNMPVNPYFQPMYYQYDPFQQVPYYYNMGTMGTIPANMSTNMSTNIPTNMPTQDNYMMINPMMTSLHPQQSIQQPIQQSIQSLHPLQPIHPVHHSPPSSIPSSLPKTTSPAPPNHQLARTSLPESKPDPLQINDLNLGKMAPNVEEFVKKSQIFSINDAGAGLLALMMGQQKAKSQLQTESPGAMHPEYWRCRLPPPLNTTPQVPRNRQELLKVKPVDVQPSITNIVRTNSTHQMVEPLMDSKLKIPRMEIQKDLFPPTLQDQKYFIHLFWWYQPHQVPYCHTELIPWREEWCYQTSWCLAFMALGCQYADSRFWSRPTRTKLTGYFAGKAKDAVVRELQESKGQPRLETVVALAKLVELVSDLGHGEVGESLIQLIKHVHVKLALDDFDLPLRQKIIPNHSYPDEPVYLSCPHGEIEFRLRLWWAITGLDRAAASMMQRSPWWWGHGTNFRRLPCPDRIWAMTDVALMDRELFLAIGSRISYQSWVDMPFGPERQAWMSRVVSSLADESMWSFGFIVSDLNRKSRELSDWIRDNRLDPVEEQGPLGQLLTQKRNHLEANYHDFWKNLPPGLLHLDRMGDGDGMIRYAIKLDIPHQYAVALPFNLVMFHLAFMTTFLPYELAMIRNDKFLLSPKFSLVSERAIIITRIVYGAKQCNSNFDLIPVYTSYGLMTAGCVQLAALRKVRMVQDEEEVTEELERDVAASLDGLRLLSRHSTYVHRSYMIYKAMVEAQGYDVQVIGDEQDEMDQWDSSEGWSRQGERDLDILRVVKFDVDQVVESMKG